MYTVILTETCMRYYEDKRIYNGKNTSVKWRRKYLPTNGMFVSQTITGVVEKKIMPATSAENKPDMVGVLTKVNKFVKKTRDSIASNHSTIGK